MATGTTFGLLNPSNNPQDFTSVFSAGQAQTNANIAANTAVGLSVGYGGDVGWSAPENQLVRIISSQDLQNPDGVNEIIALLDRPFSMSSSSDWKALVGTSTQLDEILQAVSKNQISGVSVYSARRIWTGSDPLSLNLNLKFYAVNNSYNEVLSPCIRLQRMALPSYTPGNLSLLTPPGPSPYNWTAATASNTTGDYIQIYIAGFLLFDPVIIKRVTVEFENKYDINGYPMGANVQVEFQTYQVMSKADISKSIQGPGGPLSQPVPQTQSSISGTTLNLLNKAAGLALGG